MKHSPLRILIVEDEPFIAWDQSAILENLDYDVVGIAASGEGAIQIAEQSKLDLIVMSVKLAGKMDGREAAAKIQKLQKTPVLYVSAYGRDQIFESLEVPSTRSIGYIAKPFTTEELESEVNRMIG